MAYQPVSGLFFPALEMFSHLIGGTAFSTFTMNASGSKVACIFEAPFTGTLDTIGFFSGTVTVSGTLKVSFQTVSATTGDPSGTIDQYRTISVTTANTWYTTGKITTDGTDSGSQRAVNKGDLVAVVIEFNSFSTENLLIQMPRLIAVTNNGQSYSDYMATTTWAKQTLVGVGVAVKYTNGNYYPIAATGVANSTTVQTNVTTSTNPNEVGNLFTVPFACKVDGVWVFCDPDSDTEVDLYNGSAATPTSPLASITIDKDIRSSTALMGYLIPFSSELELTAGTPYRLTIKPLSTTNVSVPNMTVSDAGHWNQFSDGGAAKWTQRQNSSSNWAETSTRRAFVSLRVSQLSDVITGGGGSGISRARTQGGM